MLLLITNRCSMGCPHCMVDALPYGKSIDFKTLFEVISFTNKANVPVIVVSGGEPTEHSEFFLTLEYILKESNSKILLATNGWWLDNGFFTKEISRLYNSRPFMLQVTAVPDLYPKAEKIISLFNKTLSNNTFSFLENMTLVTKMTCIDKLGRAKDFDYSFLDEEKIGGPLYKRRAPGCFNTISISQSVSDFGAVSKSLIETGTFCKPMVNWDGNIYIGESLSCVCVGNVNDGPKEVFLKIRNSMPCGNCSVTLPEELRSILEIRRAMYYGFGQST